MDILAISGGNLLERETLKLDRFSLDLTGKLKPKVLFIPTASYDSEGYCEAFKTIYQTVLGSEVSFLLLDSTDKDSNSTFDKISAADLIYVGGGNTLRMMNVWRKRGIDNFLKSFVNSNKILSGLSAGAICWYDFGHSDSRKTKTSEYIKVKGLGLRPGIFCPHFDSEKREKEFTSVVAKASCTGYGCDDLTAIWHKSDSSMIVKSLYSGSFVNSYRKTNGKLEHNRYSNEERIS